jgi:hypothetical protein
MTTSDMSLSHAIDITLQEIRQYCVHLHTQIDEHDNLLLTCYNNDDKRMNANDKRNGNTVECKTDAHISFLHSLGDINNNNNSTEKILSKHLMEVMEIQSFGSESNSDNSSESSSDDNQ